MFLDEAFLCFTVSNTVIWGMCKLRSYSTLLLVLFAGSAAFGQPVQQIPSQIQASGHQIHDESLPPQSALFFSFQLPISPEFIDVENNHLSSAETNHDKPSPKGVESRGNNRCRQEFYRANCFLIEPGLSLRKLIFPHHVHT